MVPYNLPNGKTIYLPAEKLLDLSDEDIQDYMAEDSGSFVQDPFYDSTLYTKESDEEEQEDSEEDDEEDYTEFFDEKPKE